MSNFAGTWQAYALASAFFASLTAIFGKIGVAKINSDLATLIRTIVIFFVLLLIISVKKVWIMPENLSTKSVVFLILSGIATGLSWMFYYRALQIGEASRVAPIDKLSVAFTVLFALLFLGEPFSWKILVGAFLILSGSILVVL